MLGELGLGLLERLYPGALDVERSVGADP
jgi:hypothetical protein